jgi:hypothetical protein
MRARVYSVRLRDSWWVLTAPTNSILSSEFCASYGGTATRSVPAGHILNSSSDFSLMRFTCSQVQFAYFGIIQQFQTGP